MKLKHFNGNKHEISSLLDSVVFFPINILFFDDFLFCCIEYFELSVHGYLVEIK